MKSLFKVFGILLIAATAVLVSCSKDDNPADNDLFVGTYNGTVTYITSGSVTHTSGSITVVKTGNNYTFNFNSSDIPNITGITIAKGDQGYVGTVNGYSGTINIDAHNLTIAVAKDGANWGANCSR